MNDFYILFDPADHGWAAALAEHLRERYRDWNAREGWKLDRVPEIREVEGLHRLPQPSELGPLGMVLLVLPSTDRNGFRTEEVRAIEDFRSRPGAGAQLLPVAPSPDRNVPPEPLSAIVSFRLHDVNDPVSLRRMEIWLLNQVGLRASAASRSVFVSYRAKDGKHAAIALSEKLRRRGYEVFRDEDLDKDEQTLLPPGAEAQQKLHQEIDVHSIVLLVDSPLVTESKWVKEEVDTALSRLKTIVPVVIADPSGRRVRTGGRFEALRELEIEVRVDTRALSDSPGDQDAAFDDGKLDDIERVMLGQLLGQLLIRKTVVPATQNLIERELGYSWESVSEDRLLFLAEQVREDPFTPWLRFRVLVLCWPYDAVIKHTVNDLARLLCAQVEKRHCQYGLVVHGGSIVANRHELLETCGGHLMILEPNEIDKLPLINPRATT